MWNCKNNVDTHITKDHVPVSTLLSSRTHTAQSWPRPRSGPPPCSPAWPGCSGSSRSPCRWRSSRRWRWCWWPASWPPAAASPAPAPRWWSGSRGCSAPAGSPSSPPPRRSCSGPCWSSCWQCWGGVGTIFDSPVLKKKIFDSPAAAPDELSPSSHRPDCPLSPLSRFPHYLINWD